MKVRILLFFIILLVLIGVGYIVFSKFVVSETFAEISFLPPGISAPNNSCYEYIKENQISLGDNDWDRLKRGKILNMLVPGKDAMLQTKASGQVMDGTCIVPKEIHNILGVDSSCTGLERNSESCYIPIADKNKLFEFVDKAYEVYDKDLLTVIKGLEQEIADYKFKNSQLIDEHPILLSEYGKYDDLVAKLKADNKITSQYCDGLKNCIAGTKDAIQKNRDLHDYLAESIAYYEFKSRQLDNMIAFYEPYANVSIPPHRKKKKPKKGIKITVKDIKRYFIGKRPSYNFPKAVPPVPPKPITCRTAYTNWSDAGGKWASDFLDRHQVQCGDYEVLNSVQLETNNKKRQQRYKYQCCNVPPNTRTKETSRVTDWNEPDKWNTYFLDRHNLDCGMDFLKGFQLEVSRKPEKIHYKYACNALLSTKSSCRDVQTPWNTESRETRYLDRHHVKCDPGEGLSRMQLQRDYKGNFRYEYKCCVPKVLPEVVRDTTIKDFSCPLLK